MNDDLTQALHSLEAVLLSRTETDPNRDVWVRALRSLARLAQADLSRLDLKILAATLEDLEQGYRAFSSYRHQRKVTIFGSARLEPTTPEYQQAVDFAAAISRLGFMVLTGGGGGIMEAGNRGAGLDNTFGLNIQLPFEQLANPILASTDRVINFKYFFSRKLFFVKESDAVVLFPGGFGTQDEAFECLTLMQTGRTKLLPLILVDKPGGKYWQEWDHYIRGHVLIRGLISPEDLYLYRVTDDVEAACGQITQFYQVFHSNRYVGEQLVIRLNAELTESAVADLNEEFSDILTSGDIQKSSALPEEQEYEIAHLPRLILNFNQRNFGRLWQLVYRLNQLPVHTPYPGFTPNRV